MFNFDVGHVIVFKMMSVVDYLLAHHIYVSVNGLGSLSHVVCVRKYVRACVKKSSKFLKKYVYQNKLLLA